MPYQRIAAIRPQDRVYHPSVRFIGAHLGYPKSGVKARVLEALLKAGNARDGAVPCVAGQSRVRACNVHFVMVVMLAACKMPTRISPLARAAHFSGH